ncbi:hypothetical protein DV738_g653, partial [Chaetothyriales sp. CBS 135597]
MPAYTSPMASNTPFAASTHHPVPAGTFLPGTKVQVGTHRVVIERYLSEGGFAHVYVVQLPRPVDGSTKAVLKRVAVPDKEHLANMRTEVETMKKLRGQNKHIVKYIDSHASQLKGGGYEVFLLMEFCQGGGLIDFMNTRLQNRLTEPEILEIFTDIAEGVACMHYLDPPLLHRDLKVENVLIATSGTGKVFKLCDFGSSAPPRPAPTSAAEARLVDDDVQRHTTLQYRSPEMIDVYRKLPIDEKSDIWALGVFLYKLCYYTTPFEEVGHMAILTAKFNYPPYPRFSDQIKLLIATMLREKPSERPTIYQVLQKACQLTKRELPVRDIYAHRSRSEGGKDVASAANSARSQPTIGATFVPDSTKKDSLAVPQPEPMRRGRPSKPVSHHASPKVSPSPLRMVDPSDPFHALDTGKPGPVDEFASKFPTLDDFAIINDAGKKFQFDTRAESKSEPRGADLAQRVTNALADEAFATTSSSPPDTQAKVAPPPKPTSLIDKERSLEPKDLQPQKPSTVLSTDTSTPPVPKPKPFSDRPIWKVPQPDASKPPAVLSKESKEQSKVARLVQEDGSRSQTRIPDHELPQSPTSSRPSLEGGRPTVKDAGLGLTRTRSLNLRNRPVSVNISKAPTHIDEAELRRPGYTANFVSAELDDVDSSAIESESNVHSSVDFLKELEGDEKERRSYHKRLSSGSSHTKRSSLPHIAVSSTKLLAGRFGDALKRFDGGENGHRRNPSHARDGDRRSSPSRDRLNQLPPIAGSEATDLSDDRLDLVETEDLSPEMRRELEKMELEAEERRVANAAAAYRQRVAGRSRVSAQAIGRQKAASIQNKVQSLLNENARPVQKTAEGYGKYTNNVQQDSILPQLSHSQSAGTKTVSTPAPVPPKPAAAAAAAAAYQAQTSQPQNRPSAPPKPQVLRTATGATAAATASGPGPKLQQDSPASPDDWEAKFNQRYPKLSGIEMVETSIDTSKRPPVKAADTFTEDINTARTDAGVNKDTSPGHATLDQESLKDPVNSKRRISKRLSREKSDKSHKQSPGKSPAKQDNNKRVSSRSNGVKQPAKKQEPERVQHENTSTESGYNKLTADMAPVNDPQDVSTGMKTVVQNMFDVTQTVVGFVPESQNLLVDRVDQLVQNLAHLTNITDPHVSPDNPVHGIKIAPEIVDYVDDGRNPDIFSRDFVERVQRGNMVMKGKQEAFRSFAQVFAEELKKGIGGVNKQVDQVMENAGFDKEKKEKREEERHAENGETN